jgi:methylmalonyl-CoA mutase cobalamin-binding domain/chain
MDRPIRVLVSKIGLDGHDRGVKLIVRNLRDAGMEVIYTGLWQTPASTVQAAVQEDVDVLGVSLLSAAHMTIMPEVQRLCRLAGVPDLPLVVGGIIPEEDGVALRQAGIGVFTPGTPMSGIVESIRELARAYRQRQAQVPAKLDVETPAALARTITWVIEGRVAVPPSPEAAKAGRSGEAYPPSPIASAGQSEREAPASARRTPRASAERGAGVHAPALTIGVTGSPGVGKSTFIGKLARALEARNYRVGVIAIDPTSPITGGSLLGDRLRMMTGEPDDRLFVRSLSSAGQAGGLAPHCAQIVTLMAIAGYQIILVETVGAGQSDTDVRNLTDQVLLLLMPGSGDSVQFSKAGVVEIATGFVVNKADLPGAEATIRQLKEALEDDRPVWPVSSLRGEGLDPLCDWMQTLM